MNIAPTNTCTASSANVCRRYALVRRVALVCMLVCAGIPAAQAQQRSDERGGMHRDDAAQAQRGQPQRQADQGRGDQRQFDPRQFEARADEQRRQLQMQQEQNARNAEAVRRSGRMTPDERRDLRRQINEAGIDLYPNTPRR
jgi:hypothetical protein